jgi:hypothetical protein
MEIGAARVGFGKTQSLSKGQDRWNEEGHWTIDRDLISVRNFVARLGIRERSKKMG